MLGAPGAGKGTQTSRLLKEFPSLHAISSGDLLRQQIEGKTRLGSLATSYMAQGKLLPDDLITTLILSHLRQSEWLAPAASWLLDGFPRTADQARMLDHELAKARCAVNLVVELNVPKSVILERIENRYVHVPSGRIYNLQYNPPKVAGKDDITGEPLSKRIDDTVEVFSKRLDQYEKTVTPLRDYYNDRGILRTISGNTSDIIFPKLSKLIENQQY